MLVTQLLDVPRRLLRRLGNDRRNYRDHLFEELRLRLGASRPGRVLEIGPRDGVDTARLLSLEPESFTLAELPNMKDRLEKALHQNNTMDRVEIHYGNVMYDQHVAEKAPFDLIWCTGVLYHNAEQLRMIVRLFEWLADGGILVLETASARRFPSRFLNCVEVWEDTDPATHKRHHISQNVIHLPSRKAVASWLRLAGFSVIHESDCHRRQSFDLAADRVAYICERRNADEAGTYYRHTGGNYRLGHAL